MIRMRRLPPVATAVVAVLATLAPADTPRGPTPISPGLHFPSDPSAGAERFERFQCSRCHAIGSSAERIGPNLGRLDLRMPFMDGAAVLWNHLPGMDRQMEASRIPRPLVYGDDLLNLVAFYTTYQYYVTRVGRAGQALRGEVLFREKNCSGCHTVKVGEPSKAPNLHRYGGGRSVLELAQTMWNHGPKMQEMLEGQSVPRPHFRDREMADLLAYLATSGAPAGAASAYIEPGSPARGAEVFAARGCSRCHAVRGQGGTEKPPPGEPLPPDLGRLPDGGVRDYTQIASLMWNHAVPMWSRMKRLNIPMEPLQGSDLADLVAFLFFVNFADESGDAAQGAAIYAGTCRRCHGAHGQGADNPRVPALARVVGLDTPWDVMAAMFRSAPKMRALMMERGIEWPVLHPGDMRHLMAYIRELRRGGKPER